MPVVFIVVTPGVGDPSVKLSVLSVSEGQENKAMRVKENRLLIHKWIEAEYVAVDEELAKIRLPNEEMMVADCDHYQLCTYNDPEFRQKLLKTHGRTFGRSGRSSVALSTGLGEAPVASSPL